MNDQDLRRVISQSLAATANLPKSGRFGALLVAKTIAGCMGLADVAAELETQIEELAVDFEER